MVHDTTPQSSRAYGRPSVPSSVSSPSSVTSVTSSSRTLNALAADFIPFVEERTTTTVTKTRTVKRTYLTPLSSPTKGSPLGSNARALTKTPPRYRSPSPPPSPPSPPSSPPIDIAPAPRRTLSPSSSSSLIPERIHPVPHPTELVPPRTGQYIQGYYVVSRGRECGIFYNWNDTNERITGNPHATHQMYRNWDDALAAYTVAYAQGHIKASPEPNSEFWTTPHPPFRVSQQPLSASEEALWSFAGEDAAARQQLADVTGKINGLAI